MRRGQWCVLFLMMLVGGYAHACSCGGPMSACSSYWSTPVVFHGKVVAKRLVRPSPIDYKRPDGTSEQLQAPGQVRVQLAVSEMFRGGERPSGITVSTNEQGSACGYNFQQGQDYLVFAYPDKDGNLQVSHCGMTHVVQDKDGDADLQWIHGLATAPPGALLSGRIRVVPGVPPDGVRVLLDRVVNGANVPGTHREIKADNAGNYRVEGLPAGMYAASLVTPPGTTADPPVRFTAVEKGCTDLWWNVSNDSHILGRVVDAVGAPVGDMAVALLTPDKRYSGGWAETSSAITGADGTYHFDRVPPGDYVLAANQYGSSPRVPYPARYYPQAKTRDGAARLHVALAQNLAGIDIPMPMAMHTVAVPVEVFNRDGRPATVAISVEGRVVSTPFAAEVMQVTADKSGRATLLLYEGEEYYLTALDSSGAQQRCGGPLRVTVAAGLATQVLRIEHPWGNCLAQLNPNFHP